MLDTEIDYVDAVVEHEATILGENIYWDSGNIYPMEALMGATIKLLTINN